MCNHGNRRKIGECTVCLNCGLTVLPNGHIYFDRDLPNYRKKKKKRGKK